MQAKLNEEGDWDQYLCDTQWGRYEESNDDFVAVTPLNDFWGTLFMLFEKWLNFFKL